jgi:hypothetical protein
MSIISDNDTPSGNMAETLAETSPPTDCGVSLMGSLSMHNLLVAEFIWSIGT